MEGREAMTLPGSASYYLQRGVSVPGTQSGIHGPTGFRPLPNPNMPVQSNVVGNSVGTTFPPAEPSPSIAPHGVNVALPQGEPVRRKRGRPRKYGNDGANANMSLGLSPMSAPPPASSSLSPTEKRGRGRPRGTGRKQQLSSLGELISGSAGSGFTPHIITVEIGEDISTKIMSFSQQGPRAVCILSATGAVSTATLRQPATSGGSVTYEGRFEIISLSGSFMLTDTSGSRSRTGGLSISLSNPDGRMVGGGVGGMLIAASPVQVIVGSFAYNGSKIKNSAEPPTDSGAGSDGPTGDASNIAPTSNNANNHTLTSTTSMGGGWPGSRSGDMRGSAHFDIDLTRG